jgi:hypothetical protein
MYVSKKQQPTTRLTGRDAGTGQFIPVKQARANPAQTVVERLPLLGNGLSNQQRKR